MKLQYDESLPQSAFVVHPVSGQVVLVQAGVMGYYELEYQPPYSADELNAAIGISKEQAAAMLAGSMFGWDAPAAQLNKKLS